MSAPFTHTPIAPHVPSTAGHTCQRYFTGSGDEHDSEVIAATEPARYTTYTQASLRVYRNDGNDTAEVTLRLALDGHSAETSCLFSAPELREIAQRLLDAAHDIETYPAALLEAQADQAEAVPE